MSTSRISKLLVWALSWYRRLGLAVYSVLVLLSQHSELDCEENKLEVRLFDKQVSNTKIDGKQIVKFR